MVSTAAMKLPFRVLGARTVVEAVKYSKQVAEEMDEYLTKRREK